MASTAAACGASSWSQPHVHCAVCRAATQLLVCGAMRAWLHVAEHLEVEEVRISAKYRDVLCLLAASALSPLAVFWW